MSFGTGHHATTGMMVEYLLELDCKEKQVVDFGTGTGVLAILAEKMGASAVKGIDADEGSITNAKENLDLNGCQRIELVQLDHYPADWKADLILANINREVIRTNFKTMAAALNDGGQLVVSGILQDDIALIESEAKGMLVILSVKRKNNWAALAFSK